MDDGVAAVVEVPQTYGHVLEDGVIDFPGHGAVAVQALAEGRGEELHHQNWRVAVRLEVNAQELDDVRVAKLAQQATFLFETSD